MDTVSVDQAIKEGRKLLYWGPRLIFISFVCISSFIFIVFEGNELAAIFGLSCLLFSIVVPSIYYLWMLPKWRIWAFSNIRNVHELETTAKLAQICPIEDRSILWKFEIKNAEQKEQINQLNEKFNLPDIFEEDFSVPVETSYSYSMVGSFIYLLWIIGFLISACVLFLVNKVFLGSVTLIPTVPFIYMLFNRLSATGPSLILSNDGITSEKNGFHFWEEIKNEQIYVFGEGHSYCLSYEIDGNTIRIPLSELIGINSYKVDHVLRTYRGRYEASKINKMDGGKSIGANM